jgi:BMFP domain-containing protein YqiC
MLDPKLLDDLSRRLARRVPSGLGVLQEDLRRHLRRSLETALGSMDLITREEFDVQTAVLARTREKLEKLERRVTELERELHTAEPDG